MTDAKERHSDRQAREAATVLADIIEAGGTINVRFDKAKGGRVAVRFDNMDGAHDVRLFIAYRTAKASHPDAIRKAALAMVTQEMDGPPTVPRNSAPSGD